ncbi:MAG: hypothetical protein JKY60_20380 [Kordiimonadaceae bacterium]|nr:hypothetical protein [Kordiimonadaceae bacterium]
MHEIIDLAPLEIYPLARFAGGTVNTTDVFLFCSLVNDVQAMKIDKRGLVNIQIEVTERL